MKITGKVSYYKHEVVNHSTGDIHKKHFIIEGIKRHNPNGYINQDSFHVIFSFGAADKINENCTHVGTLVTACFDPTTRIWKDRNNAEHVSQENRGWFMAVADEEAQKSFEAAQAAEDKKVDNMYGEGASKAPIVEPVAISQPEPATTSNEYDLPF